jgi:predicted RNA polymerase sigma factor
VPSADDIRERLAGVLAVVYLVFNQGYLASEGDDPVRVDLTDEAIHLGRLLRTLLPDDGEVAGLLALMLLTDARQPARVSRTGELVTLDEQDRGAWDRTLIAEGNALVRERLEALAARGDPPGRYQLQAAIKAVHTDAPSARDTDWSTVVALYGRMVLLDPSPIVRLNRAVAVADAEVDGPGVGLAEIDGSPRSLTATTPSTPRAPTCYGDSDAAASRGQGTTGPSVSPATSRSGATSPAAATSLPADRHVEPARSSNVRGRSGCNRRRWVRRCTAGNRA